MADNLTDPYKSIMIPNSQQKFGASQKNQGQYQSQIPTKIATNYTISTDALFNPHFNEVTASYISEQWVNDKFQVAAAEARKLYVEGHIDKVAFAQLLTTYGIEGLAACEFIDVADHRRDEIERERKHK